MWTAAAELIVGRIEFDFGVYRRPSPVGVERGLYFRTGQPTRPELATAASVPGIVLDLRFLDFALQIGKANLAAGTWMDGVSLYFPLSWLVAGGMLPFILAWRKIKALELAEYRREHGLCASCGYDLRGSKSVCSECGEIKRDSSELNG